MLSARILYLAAILTIVQGAAVQSVVRDEAFGVSSVLVASLYSIPYIAVLAAIFTWIDRRREKEEPRIVRWICAFGITAATHGTLYAVAVARAVAVSPIVIAAIAGVVGVAFAVVLEKQWIWFRATELLPGLVVGLALTHIADGIINLVIFDAAADPQRFMLFAAMNAGTIAGSVTMASIVARPHRLDPVLAVASAVALVAISYQNRVALLSIPKLYAHLILAYFEWMCAIGVVSFSRVMYSARESGTEKRGLEKRSIAMIVVVGISVVALIIPRNPRAPIPRRLEPFSELLATPIASVLDIDGDGFISTWFGGLDCDEGNDQRHPMRRETTAGVDQNCNGVAFEPPPARTKKGFATPMPDLTVLITIDQLRPDHMNLYGYEKATTPTLAGQTEFTVFQNAYAPGGITTLSLPSYLSGRYVFSLDLVPIFRTTTWRYVNRGEQKPPERLDVPFASAQGPWLLEQWRNAGKPAAVVIDDLGQHLARSVFNLSDVADLTSVEYGESTIGRERATERALKHIREMATGGFLWLHYYDPHAAPRTCKQFALTKTAGCYDDAIHDIDAQIGRVFETLKSAGRWDDSTIIVTSDHGEGFGEHGFAYHGVAPYEEFVRVPLMIKLPGAEKLPSPTRQVSALDAIRTMAHVAGYDTKHGHDLRDAEPRSLPILTYFLMLDPFARPFSQQTLMINGNDRVVYDRIRGVTQVFDVGEDPEQRSPFFDAEKQRQLLQATDRVESFSSDLPEPKTQTIISKPRELR